MLLVWLGAPPWLRGGRLSAPTPFAGVSSIDWACASAEQQGRSHQRQDGSSSSSSGGGSGGAGGGGGGGDSAAAGAGPEPQPQLQLLLVGPADCTATLWRADGACVGVLGQPGPWPLEEPGSWRQRECQPLDVSAPGVLRNSCVSGCLAAWRHACLTARPSHREQGASLACPSAQARAWDLPGTWWRCSLGPRHRGHVPSAGSDSKGAPPALVPSPPPPPAPTLLDRPQEKDAFDMAVSAQAPHTFQRRLQHSRMAAEFSLGAPASPQGEAPAPVALVYQASLMQVRACARQRQQRWSSSNASAWARADSGLPALAWRDGRGALHPFSVPLPDGRCCLRRSQRFHSLESFKRLPHEPGASSGGSSSPAPANHPGRSSAAATSVGSSSAGSRRGSAAQLLGAAQVEVRALVGSSSGSSSSSSSSGPGTSWGPPGPAAGGSARPLLRGTGSRLQRSRDPACDVLEGRQGQQQQQQEQQQQQQHGWGSSGRKRAASREHEEQREGAGAAAAASSSGSDVDDSSSGGDPELELELELPESLVSPEALRRLVRGKSGAAAVGTAARWVVAEGRGLPECVRRVRLCGAKCRVAGGGEASCAALAHTRLCARVSPSAAPGAWSGSRSGAARCPAAGTSRSARRTGGCASRWRRAVAAAVAAARAPAAAAARALAGALPRRQAQPRAPVSAWRPCAAAAAAAGPAAAHWAGGLGPGATASALAGPARSRCRSCCWGRRRTPPAAPRPPRGQARRGRRRGSRWWATPRPVGPAGAAARPGRRRPPAAPARAGQRRGGGVASMATWAARAARPGLRWWGRRGRGGSRRPAPGQLQQQQGSGCSRALPPLRSCAGWRCCARPRRAGSVVEFGAKTSKKPYWFPRSRCAHVLHTESGKPIGDLHVLCGCCTASLLPARLGCGASPTRSSHARARLLTYSAFHSFRKRSIITLRARGASNASSGSVRDGRPGAAAADEAAV
jgi:hypothetical protein